MVKIKTNYAINILISLCLFALICSQSSNGCGNPNPNLVSDCLASSTPTNICCMVTSASKKACYYYGNNSTYINLAGSFNDGTNKNGNTNTIDCGGSLLGLNDFFGVAYCNSASGNDFRTTNVNSCLNAATINNRCCYINTVFAGGILNNTSLQTCLATTPDFIYTTLSQTLFSKATGSISCSNALTTFNTTLNNSSFLTYGIGIILMTLFAFIL